MDAKPTEDSSKLIVTDTDYSPEYRFRLWVALVDDLDFLGMGYRSYHSHIMRSFQEWSKLGYKFIHPRGHDLNLPELTHDDLYGFLGKSSDHPTGPARNIKVHKFAVLDAFFKTKYPERAAAFKEAHVLEALAYAGRMFLAGSDAKETPKDGEYTLSHFINLMNGVYFNESVEQFAEGNNYYLSVYLFKPAPGKKYAYVWKIFFPFEQVCIDSIQSDKGKNEPIDDGYNTNPIVIYEGIGFFARSSLTDTELDLVCMTRDRRTYFPGTASLHFTNVGNERVSTKMLEQVSVTESVTYNNIRKSKFYFMSLKIHGDDVLINEQYIFYIMDFCSKLSTGDSK